MTIFKCQISIHDNYPLLASMPLLLNLPSSKDWLIIHGSWNNLEQGIGLLFSSTLTGKIQSFIQYVPFWVWKWLV